MVEYPNPTPTQSGGKNKEADPSRRLLLVEENGIIRLTLASEKGLVERAVRSASAFAATVTPAGGDPDDAGSFPELERVLRELLLNAVIHGNREAAEKQVLCEISREGADLFRLTVKDEGEGFDHRTAAALASSAPQWEVSGGFGLIRSICEQIDFNETGNQVTVYLRRPQQTRYETGMEGDRAVIRPTGNITAASAPDLKQQLVDLIDAGVTRYRFDLERVAEIDSMSLTVFVVLVKMLMKTEGHGELEIVNCSDNIRKLFALTRLDSHYLIL